jgi:hypothetical protein
VATKARNAVRLGAAAFLGYFLLAVVDILMARQFLPATVADSYTVVAIFTRGVLMLAAAVVTVLIIRSTKDRSSDAATLRTVVYAWRTFLAVGLLIAATFSVASRSIVDLLLGTGHSDTIGIFGILAFHAALIASTVPFAYLFVVRQSYVALTPGLGFALVGVFLTFLHHTAGTIAIVTLLVSSTVFFMMSISGLLSLALAAALADARATSFVEFSPAQIDLTLVVPFYNPGSRFGGHIEDIIRVLETAAISFEVLAVSDGSTDHSEDQLATIHSQYLRLTRLDHNYGKGTALRVGLSQGRGEYLGFIDADGDLNPNVLTALLQILETDHPDIIFGSKRHPRSEVVYPPLRRFYSWAYQQLNRILFRLPIRDTQTGVKVVRRDVLASVLPRMVEKRFAFDLELFVVAKKFGFQDFVEMPVNIGERFTSTVSTRAVRGILLDTFAIFYRLRILHFYDREITVPQFSSGGSHTSTE